MPPSKTCSQIRFLIFRHPLVPLFQQSRKSDPPFLSVKVNHCLCIETSQFRKTPKGPPPFEKKKNVSEFTQILCVRPFDHKDFKKYSLIFFLYFSNAQGPQKNFEVKNFKLLEKNVRSGFTGSWQIPKGTKS